MSSLNRVIIIGNLGADPETRYLPSGEAVTNIRVATSRKWNDKSTGELKEETEWHRVSLFGKQATVAGEYLAKGSKVAIEGRLRTRKWQDKEGQDRYSTEIVSDHLVLLGSANGAGGGRSRDADHDDAEAQPRMRRQAGAKTGGKFDDMDDDIPF